VHLDVEIGKALRECVQRAAAEYGCDEQESPHAFFSLADSPMLTAQLLRARERRQLHARFGSQSSDSHWPLWRSQYCQ
jgi:hypothetical protein